MPTMQTLTLTLVQYHLENEIASKVTIVNASKWDDGMSAIVDVWLSFITMTSKWDKRDSVLQPKYEEEGNSPVLLETEGSILDNQRNKQSSGI